MWYQWQRTSAFALLMGLLAMAAMGCGGSISGDGGKPGEATPATATGAAAPQPSKVANQIAIDNFAFEPSKLTVAVGTKVTWVNHDDVPHTATSSDKPKRFDSRTLDTDDQFSHVFTAPGTYPYFCAVHPHMTGQIIVK